MIPFEGRSVFWWQVPSVLKGDPEACADLLKENGFDAVWIKTGYYKWAYSPPGDYAYFGENLKREMVDALHAKGIAVVGWALLHGESHRWNEADIASAQVNKFYLDGYIWDVETDFENNDTRVRDAQDICVRFRERSDVPMGFCSWAQFKSPSGGRWHADDYAFKFMEYCDYGLPMVYWPDGTDPAERLRYATDDWARFTDKPILPIGRAYNGDGGDATPDDMHTFVSTLMADGLKGMSWWVLDQAANPRYQDGAILDALKEMNDLFGATLPNPDPEPPPIEPPVEPPVEEPDGIVTGKLLYGMNLRTSPVVSDDNKIGYLYQYLEVIGVLVPEGNNTWMEMDGGTLGNLYVAVEHEGVTYTEIVPEDDPEPDPEPPSDRPSILYSGRQEAWKKVPVYNWPNVRSNVQSTNYHGAIFVGDKVQGDFFHATFIDNEPSDGWIPIDEAEMFYFRVPEKTLNYSIPKRTKPAEIVRSIIAPGERYWYLPISKVPLQDGAPPPGNREVWPDTMPLFGDNAKHPGWVQLPKQWQYFYLEILMLDNPGKTIEYYVAAYASAVADNRAMTDLHKKDEHTDHVLGMNLEKDDPYWWKWSITFRGNMIRATQNGGTLIYEGLDIRQPPPDAAETHADRSLCHYFTQVYPKPVLLNGFTKNVHAPQIKEYVGGKREKIGTSILFFKAFDEDGLPVAIKKHEWVPMEPGVAKPVVNLSRDQ